MNYEATVIEDGVNPADDRLRLFVTYLRLVYNQYEGR